MGENDRPTWVRYQVLAAMCLLALVTYVQRNGFASTGTGLKADLGLSAFQWGVLMAAFLVAYASFEVPWGVVGDRLGARHLLTLLVLGWSLLTFDPAPGNRRPKAAMSESGRTATPPDGIRATGIRFA